MSRWSAGLKSFFILRKKFSTDATLWAPLCYSMDLLTLVNIRAGTNSYRDSPSLFELTLISGYTSLPRSSNYYSAFYGDYWHLLEV